jgi:hypothetical protein
MINDLVHHISSLSNLLGLDPVIVCVTLEEQFTDPDDEEDEELQEILDQVYAELVKIEKQQSA